MESDFKWEEQWQMNGNRDKSSKKTAAGMGLLQLSPIARLLGSVPKIPAHLPIGEFTFLFLHSNFVSSLGVPLWWAINQKESHKAYPPRAGLACTDMHVCIVRREFPSHAG
jgi:hypothetical protein